MTLAEKFTRLKTSVGGNREKMQAGPRAVPPVHS